MLDLDKLEKKLDFALSIETPDSMLGWIMKERSKKLYTILGEGIYEELPFFETYIGLNATGFTPLTTIDLQGLIIYPNRTMIYQSIVANKDFIGEAGETSFALAA